MSEKKVLVISNQNQINISNSINLDIFLPDHIHGFEIRDYISNFLDKIIDNSNIEWVIYDLKIDTSNVEDMIIFNSYLPHYFYNKYPNLNFIFISSGSVCGIKSLDETDDNSVSPFVNTISNGEVFGERSWVLRCDIFQDSLLEGLLSNESVNYGSIDKTYSFITKGSLNRIIEALMMNYKLIKPGYFNIIPKDTHTEYELLNYLCWKHKYSNYIERSSSKETFNKSIKTSKPDELKKLWKLAGYNDIPTFKSLYDAV
jgi:hypothetical protein